jgi:hypothetical protein
LRLPRLRLPHRIAAARLLRLSLFVSSSGFS